MWVATEWTGLSAAIGSWKTMAISRPRRSRSSAGDSRSTSRPLYRISPLSTMALGARRLITAETTVVLPLPLSPTSPTMLRAGTASETPRTARTGPRGVSKRTLRSRTRSSASATAQMLRRSFGSSMSRSASPRNVKPSVVTMRAPVPATISQGVRRT